MVAVRRSVSMGNYALGAGNIPFLLWGEARPECCAGDARMPLDHDQISVVPLP